MHLHINTDHEQTKNLSILPFTSHISLLLLLLLLLLGHWIIYVIDCRQNPTTIWKFDPFGERLHQPSQPDRILDQTLKQRYPKCHLLILNERVQYDGCQCGVWCCAFVTKFLSFSELSRPRLFTLFPDYFVNTNNHLEMTSNTERIRDYRKTLQLLLIDKNE